MLPAPNRRTNTHTVARPLHHERTQTLPGGSMPRSAPPPRAPCAGRCGHRRAACRCARPDGGACHRRSRQAHHHHDHRRTPAREHPGRAGVRQRAGARDPRRAEHQRPGRAHAVGPRAQPEHRVLVRPRLPALLHPRLRQHRLPAQRLAAGVAGLRRRGAGKPDPEGLPGLRPGRRRSAARPAGLAVRPQHAGRRGEVQLGQAGQDGRGLRQHRRSAPSAP